MTSSASVSGYFCYRFYIICWDFTVLRSTFVIFLLLLQVRIVFLLKVMKLL
jgi:hypothetical protein